LLIKALVAVGMRSNSCFTSTTLCPATWYAIAGPERTTYSSLVHITSLSIYALDLLVLHVFSCQPCDTGISPAPSSTLVQGSHYTCDNYILHFKRPPADSGYFKISLMLLVLSHNVERVYCRRLFRAEDFLRLGISVISWVLSATNPELKCSNMMIREPAVKIPISRSSQT
jgi:hypothetical protein